MTEEQEIDLLKDSEEMIARIISHLFQNGILKIKQMSLDEIGVASSLTEEQKKNNVFQVDKNQELFHDAMDWLIAEKVVRCDTKTITSFFGCCLTSYGFALLGQKLVGAKDNETVGKAVKNVSNDSASYANVGNLLGGLLGAFTKSIS